MYLLTYLLTYVSVAKNTNLRAVMVLNHPKPFYNLLGPKCHRKVQLLFRFESTLKTSKAIHERRTVKSASAYDTQLHTSAMFSVWRVVSWLARRV